jgi:peptidyl-prolyl isomerase E (cyclophilin E)
MSTTLVATGGKGSNPKTSLYVGGLAENVNEEILQAAFLPFGNMKDINIPLDHATGKHRGEARLLWCSVAMYCMLLQ